MKTRHIVIHGSVVALLLAALGAAWSLKRIDFFSPLWLAGLAVLPLFAALAARGISGLPPRTNTVSVTLRAALFLLLIVCLADVQIVLRNDGLCVLFLLDHSASIPEKIVQQELKYVNAAAATRARNDQVGIVVFGDSASVEKTPSADCKVDSIYSLIDKNYTDLQGAVELAAAVFPAGVRKKLVVITDGNENKGNLIDGIRFAAGHDAVTEILPVDYSYDKEVMVEKVYVPDRVKENETFDLKAHIASLQDCPATLTIYRNGLAVTTEQLNLKKGRNTYAASMRLQEPGFYAFTAKISSEYDTIPDNNEASAYVYIQGISRTLFVSPTELESRFLAQACREDQLEADIIAPEALPDSLGMLQNYDCVVLANVGADRMSQNQMSMLQANVRDLGVGLIMIGGDNSFGAGGYDNTPIEEALPVTMDIKQKKINPKGALVLVLHTCEFADGNYWAKEISKKAIETVSPQDDVGVLCYGGMGGEQWLFGIQSAGDKKFMYQKIDQANPGDMPSFEPTLKMALEGLSKSDAMVRHIIIISDGDPQAPSPELVKSIAAAGITVSTIGINPHSPRDVDVLSYIAQKTNGRYYFAQDPRALPKIFIKEAKVVRRSVIFSQKFQPQLVLATEVTKGLKPEDVPPLMAYVATTPKATATVPMISDNENHDPVLAYWQYGLGRAVAFTSDATSNWGRLWVPWDKYKKLWSQIVRWATRKREKSNLRIRSEMSGSKGTLIVDAIDKDGSFMNFLKMNARLVNPRNQGAALDIRQTAPGRYEAAFDAREMGVNILNIGYQDPRTGVQGFLAGGVSVPYSPEYRELESNIPLLRRACAAGGGRLLSGNAERDRVFVSNQPPSRSFRPIWEYLLMFALGLFFVDVAVRRVVITRDDVSAVWAAARKAIRVRIRRRRAEQDATMAALLKRKEKTFEHAAKPAAVSQEFRKTLADAAREGKAESLRLDEAAPEAATPPPAAYRPASEVKTEAKVKTKAPETSEDTYTGRLLAAKKRAKRDAGEDG